MKRLKNRHRKDCPKTPLRSFARALAATPAHELALMPPAQSALVGAAREWLASKGA